MRHVALCCITLLGGLGTAGAQTVAPLPALPALPASVPPSNSPPTAAVETLAPVTVTATRTGVPAFDVPASIDRVDVGGAARARFQVNLSDELGAVPGLVARDRQNYAQDVQLSIRGFGARSSFGIRGVRLYVDGIPATLPDGQGQITNADLNSADRIEVLRGPFSALYGNSSGGVLQVFTEDPAATPTLTLGAGLGRDAAWRLAARTSGTQGAFGWVASVSGFGTDGYRDNSAAERRLGNAKLAWALGADTRVTLIGNTLDLPQAQDPLGLSRAQFEANPRAVDPSALAFDTRKSVDQTQLGLIVEHRLDASQTLRVLVYDGHRDTQQFQSIPVATQASALHPGGVIALGREYRGTDLRWTWQPRMVERSFSLVGGLAYDTLREHRQGYLNFIGTTLGVQGALRRDEINEVTSLDPYLQASLDLGSRWTLNAGVRHSRIRFDSADRYVVGTNPDDSGSVGYGATLPAFGLLFKASDAVHLYASAGRGFETPTLNELAYRPNGATGLNLGLAPATSRSVELGVKARGAALGTLNLAWFRTRTANEIVTLTNVAGRATYQNAGATGRDGVEAAWRRDFAGSAHLALAASWIDAIYRDGFLTCNATPCTAPNVPIAAGNRLPGVPRSNGYAELAWAPALGWRGGVEWRAVGRVPVNDANSDAAAGYSTVALQGGYAARVGGWRLDGYARVDNLLDRRYIGSVIVNESNARYFEPAPGRSWVVGLAGTVGF